VTGCTKVSQGCKHCYAERFAKRLGYDFSRVELHPERLEIPLRWKKPRRVFVNSMSDLFHEKVPDEFTDLIFRIMVSANQHIFMILTKRADRMCEYAQKVGRMHWNTRKHIWLGVSVEDQATADERIPWLLKTPAAVRFVSYEPALGPVDFHLMDFAGDQWGDWRRNRLLNWIICGGESGPGARPMHPDWVRSARDQCQAAGVPFFMKQWGEWTSEYPQHMDLSNREMTFEHGTTFYRVGKKAAGRVLDRRVWEEYPGGAR
jgi:protein gp37